MIIDCICGKKKFKLADGVMPAEGSKVRCGSCSEVWFYHPDQGNVSKVDEKVTENLEPPQSEIVNEQVSETIEDKQPVVEEKIENINESLPEDDPEELLSKIDTDEVTEEESIEETAKENVSNFKIFTDEEENLPSKSEMDKNLDDFVQDRDKNLNFFQKLFKKDRIKEASKSLEKEQQKKLEDEKKKSDDARRTRLLFYLLILLLIVFAVVLVPFRDKVGMAFPFMETYLEYLIPMYDYIKGPLGLG
ncbi:hypothetical protein [Candidatus Pelagibacter communis]|uniref:hypothetical protein n=1 Tax=Pelagibacter ubique TaxID=198252 RepID=UPI00065B3F57|nr:hypothetical protein [Candidatus Pelagibacter ubique]